MTHPSEEWAKLRKMQKAQTEPAKDYDANIPAVAAAARAMLAALTEVVRESDGGWWTHHPTAKIVRAAIAQAKAAGITAEAPAHVIAASGDLAKGDTP